MEILIKCTPEELFTVEKNIPVQSAKQFKEKEPVKEISEKDLRTAVAKLNGKFERFPKTEIFGWIPDQSLSSYVERLLRL